MWRDLVDGRVIALGSGNPRNGESGSVLVMVIIVIMVMLTVGITTLMVSATDSKIIVPSSKQQAEVTVPVVKVTGVTVSPKVLSLITGPSSFSKTVTATVKPENATNKNVEWISSNPSVATVNQNGVVTAVAVGTAVITARTLDGGFSDTCLVTVAVPGPYLINPDESIIFITLPNNYVAPSGHVLVVPAGSDLSGLATTGHSHINWTADAGMIIEVNLNNLGSSSFTFTASNEDADIIIATNVHLDPHKALTINAGRDIIICNIEISAGDEIYMNAGRDIKACGATVTSSKDHMTLIAAGNIWVNGASLTTTGGNANMILIAGLDIVAQSGFFDCKNNLLFTAGDTIYVTGATFKDKNNVAKASPDGINIDGAPASGAINYTG
ncbi:MAG: Ig-like domain-containing protein [Eubacteriales bacterium]|nr:Ig-like domain-containing protein [Eubacteriales bacterium]